jgi:hypothetical protein
MKSVILFEVPSHEPALADYINCTRVRAVRDHRSLPS